MTFIFLGTLLLLLVSIFETQGIKTDRLINTGEKCINLIGNIIGSIGRGFMNFIINNEKIF
jgi:hypothetical protein